MKDRIALILPSLAGGGAERVGLTLARYLHKLGVDVHLVLIANSGPLAKSFPADLHCHNLGHVRLRNAIPALLHVLRKIHPRAVISTMGYVNLVVAGMRAVLPHNTKIIIREANLPSLSLNESKAATFLRFGYRALYPFADRILCSSEMMRQEFIQDLKISSDKLYLIPNPVDVDGIRQSAILPQRRNGKGLRLVAAGRLVKQKGFDRLIELMTKLPMDSALTILGDGLGREELRAQVLSLNLQDRVHFIGFVDNPWAFYAGADLVVVPSRWEGMPNVALEAFACGTSVIATPESGGLAELAQDVPAGSLRIEQFGPAFLAAVASVVPNPKKSLRDSLLPDRFNALAVASRLLQIISTLSP